ncbi:MAG: hypothetical protein PHR53_03790 [Bacteroidales bacterium]|nr:hypothetical protein [Bacteroidales bacterium]
MKRLFYILAIFLFFCSDVFSQNENEDFFYRRSSLYSLMLNTGIKYSNELESVFKSLTTPDKFNDHDLALKSIKDPIKKSDKTIQIEAFFNKSQLAKRVVAKWFGRDRKTGAFEMQLISERGQYNASELDVQIAKMSKRGFSVLSDAGEELISNTFVLVNDISYVDKEQNAQLASLIFQAVATVAEGVASVSGDNSAGDIADLVKSASELGEDVSDMIAGFKVSIVSYLYQLEWNDDIANQFYEKYYFDSTSIDPAKKAAFEADKTLFKLKFIGMQKVVSDKPVLRGLKTNEELIRKTLSRALDKSIVELQKENEAFKVKVPIFKIDNDSIFVKIGLKEGVSEKSKFEVLEQVLNEEGKTEYKRIGVIKPIKNQIWDNRYMAIEEEAEGANLTCTTFEKVSGSDFYPGMLIREIKYTSGN